MSNEIAVTWITLLGSIWIVSHEGHLPTDRTLCAEEEYTMEYGDSVLCFVARYHVVKPRIMRFNYTFSGCVAHWMMPRGTGSLLIMGNLPKGNGSRSGVNWVIQVRATGPSNEMRRQLVHHIGTWTSFSGLRKLLSMETRPLLAGRGRLWVIIRYCCWLLSLGNLWMDDDGSAIWGLPGDWVKRRRFYRIFIGDFWC